MANAFSQNYSPMAAAFRDLGIGGGAGGSDFLASKIGAQQFDPYFLMSKYGADLSAVQDPYTIMNNAATAISGARPTSPIGSYLSQPQAVSPVSSPRYSPEVSYVAPAQQVSFSPSSSQSYAVPSVAPAPNAGITPGASGNFSYSGAPISNVTQWSPEVQTAIQQVYADTGVMVPENLVYAVMQLESGGSNVGYNDAGYGGLMQVGPGSNLGSTPFDYNYAATPQGNVYYGVTELANWYGVTGDWNTAPLAYFSGYNYNNPGTSDGHYTNADYNAEIQSNLADLGGLDAPTATQVTRANASGTPVGGSRQNILDHLLTTGRIGIAQYSAMMSAPGGSAGDSDPGTAQDIINVATSYVGQIPYPETWQGNPGLGQDPMTYGGWDCSGFMYWLDQNYGTGELPQGSHYQYQYAVDNGLLYTDMSQLMPGDLVFMDTGWYGGAGADQNNAGHVGMYIGNGQIVNSLNPSQGTVISNVTDFPNILGGMHMSWSGEGVPSAALTSLGLQRTQQRASVNLFGQPAPKTPQQPVSNLQQSQSPSLRVSANQALSGWTPPSVKAQQAQQRQASAPQARNTYSPTPSYSPPAPSYSVPTSVARNPSPMTSAPSNAARARNLF